LKRLVLAALLATAPACADDTATRLKADLLAGNSATQTLTQWCAALKLAAPPVIHAEREQIVTPASAEVRALLKVGTDEKVGYRRVRLACGTHVLSEADNWYVPSRLTPQMNDTLDHSDTPFGTVVKALNFHRNTLSADAPGQANAILTVKALLLTQAEVPFSLVVENYTSELSAPRP
jgi:chorismate-pyruvate lyase